MRLITFKKSNPLSTTRIGVIHEKNDNIIIDLNNTNKNIPSNMLAFLSMGEKGIALAKEAMNSGEHIKMDSVVLCQPITNPEKIICAGANYKDHVEESMNSGAKIAGMDNSALDPQSPVPLFHKFNTSLIGPFDDIIRPTYTKHLDYESELVIVIGKTCKGATESNALDYVAGYMLGNDITARDYQHSPKKNPAKQHFIGKTPDNSCPTGPWIVTKDEIKDPNALDLSCILNGETMQSSNTKYLIHNCQNIIQYCSMLWTLKPGDLIFTGTPSGVGAARKPPVFLKPGDIVECHIEKLGFIKNTIIDENVTSKI